MGKIISIDPETHADIYYIKAMLLERHLDVKARDIVKIAVKLLKHLVEDFKLPDDLGFYLAHKDKELLKILEDWTAMFPHVRIKYVIKDVR